MTLEVSSRFTVLLHIVLHLKPELTIFALPLNNLPVLVLKDHGLKVHDLLLDTLLVKVHVPVDGALSIINCSTQESLNLREELGRLSLK